MLNAIANGNTYQVVAEESFEDLLEALQHMIFKRAVAM